MAQCGRSLRPVQSAQVKPLRNASGAIAKRAHAARADRGEAGVPAELSARELARLSLLGQRDRELKFDGQSTRRVPRTRSKRDGCRKALGIETSAVRQFCERTDVLRRMRVSSSLATIDAAWSIGSSRGS